MQIRGMRLTSAINVVVVVIGLMLVSGCEDSKQPVMRGVKDKLQQIFHLNQDESEEEFSDSDDQQVAIEGEVEVSDEHRETARRILNLNLPDEVKYPEQDQKGAFGKTEPQWRQHARVGEHQTFPNFFEHQPEENNPESALDISGKVHWDEAAEEQTIPQLNTIEGLELEITVKTR